MTIDETIQYYLDKLPTEGGHVMVLSPDDSRHLQLVIWLTQLRGIKNAYSSFKKKWEILDIEHAATPDGEYDFFKKDMLLYDLEESIGATLNGDPSTSVRL